MQKFLASQANTATADSDDEFWLKETDLKDQEKLAKAILDHIV